MLQHADDAERNRTQIAIREALDHALAYGDDTAAFHLARILGGMAFKTAPRMPGLVRPFPGHPSRA